LKGGDGSPAVFDQKGGDGKEKARSPHRHIMRVLTSERITGPLYKKANVCRQKGTIDAANRREEKGLSSLTTNRWGGATLKDGGFLTNEKGRKKKEKKGH